MSNQALSPYRTPATLALVAEPIKQMHGIIRAPVPIPPHKCAPPGFWRQVLYWIMRAPLHENSLWRCSHCSAVKKLEDPFSVGDNEGWKVEYDGLKMWAQAGGGITEDEQKALDKAKSSRY